MRLENVRDYRSPPAFNTAPSHHILECVPHLAQTVLSSLGPPHARQTFPPPSSEPAAVANAEASAAAIVATVSTTSLSSPMAKTALLAVVAAAAAAADAAGPT